MNIGEINVKLNVDTSDFNAQIEEAAKKLQGLGVPDPKTHLSFFLPKRVIGVVEGIAIFLIGFLLGVVIG